MIKIRRSSLVCGLFKISWCICSKVSRKIYIHVNIFVDLDVIVKNRYVFGGVYMYLYILLALIIKSVNVSFLISNHMLKHWYTNNSHWQVKKYHKHLFMYTCRPLREQTLRNCKAYNAYYFMKSYFVKF